MANLGTATLLVVPKFDGFVRSVNAALGNADLSSAGSSMGSSIASGVSAKTGAVIGAVSALTTAAMNAVSSSMGSAISRVDTLKNYPHIMESLGVLPEEAEASMQVLSTSLDNVPTKLDDMANTVQGIFAATQRYGVSLGTVTDAGLALNSMLLAGGQSTQIVNSAMEQFRQMVAKGKPDLQDWRSLISAAPGQMNQLAEAMLGATATADDLYAALGGGKEKDYDGPFEWGSISMGEFVERFAEMRKQFEGAAQDAQGGIGTAFSNMQNAVTRGVASVIDTIGRENIVGAIQEVKVGINDAFKEVNRVVEAAFPELQAYVPGFRSTFEEMLSPLSGLGMSDLEISGTVGSVLSELSEVSQEIAPIAEDLIGRLPSVASEASSAFQTVWGAAKEFIGPAGEIVIGLADSVGFLYGTFRPLLDGAANLLADNAGTVSRAVAAYMGFNAVSGVVDKVKPHVKSFVDTVGKLLPAQGIVETSSLGMDAALASVSSFAFPAAAAVGVIAAGVGSYWYETEQARRHQAEFNEAIEGLQNPALKATVALQGSTEGIGGFSQSMNIAKGDVDGLIESVNLHNESQQGIRDSASQTVGMLGQYLSVLKRIDYEGADAFSSSANNMAELEWAVDGINQSLGTTYTAEQLLADAYADEAGNIVNVREEVEKLIATRQREAQAEAYQELYTNALKESALAAREVNNAQNDYNKALERADQITQEMIDLGYEESEAQEAAYKAARVEEFSQALDESNEIYKSLKNEQDAYLDALVGFGEELSAAATDVAAWVTSNQRAAALLGDSTNEFAQAAERAGITTEELSRIGEDSFADLALACSGNMDAMISALELYNGATIDEKTGKVTVNDKQLQDAQGRIIEWDGTKFVYKDTQATVDIQSLLEAIGQIGNWNDNLFLKTIEGRVNVDTSGAEAKLRALINGFNGFTISGNAVATTVGRVSGSGGRYTVNATGGQIPAHADGFIATKPTLTDYGWVGEDGAEAWNGKQLIPLTNRKYSQPFIDLLAKGVAEQGGGGVSYNFQIGSLTYNDDDAISDGARAFIQHLARLR